MDCANLSFTFWDQKKNINRAVSLEPPFATWALTGWSIGPRTDPGTRKYQCLVDFKGIYSFINFSALDDIRRSVAEINQIKRDSVVLSCDVLDDAAAELTSLVKDTDEIVCLGKLLDPPSQILHCIVK